MPLHINLLHEEQAKLVERKRDPLKIGMLVLLVIALGLYGYYLLRAHQSGKIQGDYNAMQDELSRLAPAAVIAQTAEAQSTRDLTASANLEKLINGRFYWGPFLARIATETGPEIQINRLDGTLRSDGALRVALDGLAAGAEPRTVAEHFRQKMAGIFKDSIGVTTSQFVSLEDNAATVNLQGKTYGTAIFTIEFIITPHS